jgi:hypothetical protein
VIEHAVLDELRAGRSMKISDLERGHAVSGALFPQFHSQIFRFHAENCVDIDQATV